MRTKNSRSAGWLAGSFDRYRAAPRGWMSFLRARRLRNRAGSWVPAAGSGRRGTRPSGVSAGFVASRWTGARLDLDPGGRVYGVVRGE